MKRLLLTSFLFLGAISLVAQVMPLTLEPDGGNRAASVSEQIGIVKIAITYNRPAVKGREGKIWNTPVAYYGFVDQGHGTSYAAPWRAGANQNTTITVSHPVKIEGKDLPPGTYGFFIALGEEESTLIFSKVSTSWGSFYYDAAEDALRVTVRNKSLDNSVEWLKYEFIDQADNSVTAAMSWERRMIPFKIEVDRKALQIAAFKNDFRTTRPYYDYIAAAQWCLRNDYELEQANAWMDRAIYFRVMGEKNFRSLSTKAAVLTKLGRGEEARKLMEEALPMGTITDVHFYARSLGMAKQPQEAFKVYKMNYDRHPTEFTTNVGLGRGYSALGDYKKALTYMKAALSKAPNDMQKDNVATMVKKLEEGKDVN